MSEPRLTRQVLAVLHTVAGREMTAGNIIRETRLAGGTLYPILSRLTEAGWLVARDGGQRRKYYRVTETGMQVRSGVDG